MIIKFDSFLNEGNITDVVYHRTDISALINILKTGKILLSTAMGTSNADRYSNKPYFLSLSRTKNLNFGYSKGSTVTIEFDGRELKTKYKGKTVDYWSVFNKSDISPNDRMNHDEYEDRIFSNSPYMINLDKYIKNIGIILPPFDEWNKERSEYVVRYISEIKKINSPLINKIKIYKNKIDFNYNRNGVSILDYQLPTDIDINKEDLYKYTKSFDYRLLINVISILLVDDKNINDKEYVENFIKKYFDKFIKIGVEKLKNVTENEIKSIRSDIQRKNSWLEIDRDFLPVVDADIHNISKSHGKDEINYEILKILSDEMVKYKVNNIIDLINAKRGIFKNKKFIDYSKLYSFAYKQYDRYVLVDNNKETFLNWTKLNEKDKNKIYDMGYPILTKNIINYLFNTYDFEKSKELIKSMIPEYSSQIFIDLRGKLIYKEITEKDYLGSDIGDRGCWWGYLDKNNWWKLLSDNLGEKIYKEPLLSKIMKLLKDEEVKIRFIWAVTEQLIGEEKTEKFFDDNNLIIRQSNDNSNPGAVKYILNVKGEKTEKQKDKEKKYAD